jgi:SAM-dependent methyltransferase
MSVAGHLRIELEEYDASIRAFVPGYEAMLREAAAVLADLPAATPEVVDLGIGTGALSATCLAVRPDARLTGFDADPEILTAARGRLSGARPDGRPPPRLIQADFLEAPLPACDAIVASLALHHVPTAAAKRAFYVRCAGALRPGGVLVTADRFLAGEPSAEAAEREAWLAHLERSFSRAEAEGYLSAWADEDTYFPLREEIVWLREADLAPEVRWHEPGFAVVAAWREPAAAGTATPGAPAP